MKYMHGDDSKDSSAGGIGTTGGKATTRSGEGTKEAKHAQGGGDMRTQGSTSHETMTPKKMRGVNSKEASQYIGA